MTSLTFRSVASSPYALLAEKDGALPKPQRKRSLLAMSRLVEAQTLSAPAGALILAVLQEREHYTPKTQERYQRLAGRGVQVVLFAHGWTGVTEPMPGLRLAGLTADDSVRDEWDLLVCSPRRRSGFVSRDLRDPTAAEMDRPFEWLTTQDGEALGQAAEALLMRVPPAGLQVPSLVG